MNSQSNSEHSNIDDIASLLRSRGIYPTVQRLRIAELLFPRHQHVTAENLRSALYQEGLSVSKATIYNTLSSFTEAGLLQEVVVDNNHTFFDTNTTHHHHIYNLDSGELIDINRSFPFPLEDIDIPQGTSIDSIDVVIRVRNSTP